VDGNRWWNWPVDANGNLIIDTVSWGSGFLTQGPHTVAAHYFGNSTYAPNTSSGQPITVLP
jgi:hypothetical protein